jgi:hypothetical protein
MMRIHQSTSRWSGVSRRVTIVAVIVLGAAALAATAPRAQAQISIPNINAPKQAANRAAAAANAHTAAMQDVDGPPDAAHAPPPPSAPAGAKPVAAKPAAIQPAATQPATPAHAGAQPVMSVASHPAPTNAPATPATKAAVTAGNPASAPTPAAVAAAKAGAPAVAGSAGPGAIGDSAGNSISVTQRGVKGEVSLNREVFSYDPGARRDPFISLMRSGDLRPMLSDLRLVTVLYDATGRNSIAVMRDQSTKDQYRVRVGQTLGRMRVVQIQPKQVVFTIEEVGFSRQEALALGDTTKTRAP